MKAQFSGGFIKWAKAPLRARLFGQFVVITSGVALGLFADDWRQRRDDMARQEALLAAMYADLVADSVELAAQAQRSLQWDRAAQWLDQSRYRTRVPADSLRDALAAFGIIVFYQPVSSAYVGLRDAGQLPLIRDNELRHAIVEYYELRQPYMSQWFKLNSTNWQDWSRLAPRYLDYVGVPNDSTIFQALRRPKLTGRWSDFVADDEVRGLTEIMGMMAGNTRARIQPVLRSNNDLRDLIDRVLSIER